MAIRDHPQETIFEILRESEKPVMSAQDVADELDEYSRQAIGKHLRKIVKQTESVERVEIGPSVGYYWNHAGTCHLDKVFDGLPLTRPVGGGSIPVVTKNNEILEAGDSLIVILERVGSQPKMGPRYGWEVVEYIDMDILHDTPERELIQTVLASYLTEGLSEMAYIAVQGTIDEVQYQEDGRKLSNEVLTNPSVLQYINPVE